jgi:hypothetical protein
LQRLAPVDASDPSAIEVAFEKGAVGSVLAKQFAGLAWYDRR